MLRGGSGVGLVLLVCLAISAGCGSDGAGSYGGASGHAGPSGTAGTGGTSGKAGASGTSGSLSGAGGANGGAPGGGVAGAGGANGGASGSSGASGAKGASGGASGSGGAPATGGASGGASGSGGAAGAGGGNGGASGTGGGASGGSAGFEGQGAAGSGGGNAGGRAGVAGTVGRCGNGVLDPGEVCDDGNTVSGDGCRGDCKGLERCGDGFVDVGEVCLEGPSALPSGDWPQQIVVADVNGDGIEDLLSANESTYTLAVLLGRGDGTFAPTVEYPATQYANKLVVGDFDGDGHLDAALIGTLGGDEIAMLYGRGDGTFEAPRAFADANEPEGLAAGDLDGDGKAELLVADTLDGATGTYGRFVVWSFDAARTPTRGQTLQVGARIFSPTVRDFNNDGRLDLGTIAYDNYSTVGSYVVWPGKGDGTLSGPVASSINDGGSAAVADMDGDGNLDIAIAGAAGPTLQLGHGDGTFGMPVVVGTAQGASQGDIEVADLDGDHHPDILVSNINTTNTLPSLSVFRANGDGTFADGARSDIGYAPIGLAVIDADRDGAVDLAVTSSVSLVLDLFFGRGDGTFRSQNVAITSTGSIGDVALGDLDEDGRLDMVTLDSYFFNKRILVALGRGDGTFGPQVGYPASAQGLRVTMGDLDGDGHQDVVASGTVVTAIDDLSSVWLNEISVFYGRGDGTFDPELVLTVDNQPADVCLVDLDRDGRTDIVIGQSSGSIEVIEALGGRAFASPVSISTPMLGALQIASADFNHDGNPDIAVAGLNEGLASGLGGVAVLLGKGDGTFQTPRTVFSGELAYSLRVGDFNGDGIVDIVTANPPSTTVALYLGRGDGTFQPRVVTPVLREAAEATGLVVVDFNKDGALDVLTTDEYGSSVTVLLGDGKGGFPHQRSFGADDEPIGLAVGDIDGDSRLDVAIANFGSGRITTMRGLPP
jgi:cysteine-rich repeat protein